MAADSIVRQSLTGDDAQTGLPPAVENSAIMADLVTRLDALLHSYSSEQETTVPGVTTTSGTGVPRCDTPWPQPCDFAAGAARHERLVVSPPQAACERAPRRELPDEIKAAKIMLVDDDTVNIRAVQVYLKKEGYQHFVATTAPREAIDLIRREQPDVVLLDIRMPEVSGLDILRIKALDSSLDHIPVIVLTAVADTETKRLAFDLGATDFLTKPLDPLDLAPRVRNAVLVKKHYDQKANLAVKLEELVRRRTAEVDRSQQQLILSLARAAEHRDNETGNHVLRVGRFAGIIARQLGWSDANVEMIELAAPLHDVGKVGVPDNILFKSRKLEPQEFEVIKNHCAWGKQIIEPFSGHDLRVIQSHARLGESILHVRSSAMLMMASRIAQTHHECWDGSGYPLGLVGEDIPLEGRITAVADVYDALSTKRPYKTAFPRQKCFEILEEQRGKKFDSHVLDAFFARANEIVAIQLELVDTCQPERQQRE